MTLIGTIAFTIAFGVIVFIHELGHFLVAKLFGVRVLVFSLGFGKRIAGFDFRGTDVRLSALPLGGYVRMSGEMPEERTGDPREFLARPRWERILVYLAGPAMNVVLSLALIAGAFMMGITVQALQVNPSVIGVVTEGSPGELAGIEPGDRVVEVDGKSVELWKDVSFVLLTSVDKPVELTIERGDERLVKTVTPIADPRDGVGDAGLFPRLEVRVGTVFADTPAASAGFEIGDVLVRVDDAVVEFPRSITEHLEARADQEVVVEVRRDGESLLIPVVPRADENGLGRIGIGLSIYRPLPFGEAVVASYHYNVEIVVKTAQILGKLFTGQVAAKNTLSGPIEIARVTAQAADRGLNDWVFVVGFLSIAIGIMNLLPIPILDGGHITILLIEMAIGRDLSIMLKERIMQVGFILLMMLMVMVIYFDLSKLLASAAG
ncbi:MAG: RIP metalloprotease RseP [Acidobacteriota bacterium]